MSDKPLPDFNKERVYDSEIAPLMAKVIEIAKAHRIPMFATFAYFNGPTDDDPDGVTSFCTTLVNEPKVDAIDKAHREFERACRGFVAFTITTVKGSPA